MGARAPKQLLPLGGRPVLRWTAETLAASGLREIVVVHAPGVAVAGALAGLGAVLVVNPDPDSGMADSLRAGLRAVNDAATGVLVCLADHPLVTVATIRALLDAHRDRPEAILVPLHAGRGGHPTLFPARVLRELAPGRTLRDVREAHPGLVREIAVEDAGVLFDMDTPEDYEEALARVAPPRPAVAPARTDT